MARFKTLYLLCAVSSVAVTPARALHWPAETLRSLQTQSGLFRIVLVGTGNQLWVGGNMVRELDTSGASVAAQWPPDGPPRFILLDLPTGGGSCSDLFRLLDLTPGKKPYLTGTFNGCPANPSLSVDGDNVAIDFAGTRKQRAVIWRYDAARRRLHDPRHGAVTGPLL